MEWVMLALGAVGMAYGAYSAVQETQAANKAARYNAQIANQQAEFAKDQMAQEQERGALEEKQSRLATARLIGQQRAGFAGSGVAVDQGTAANLVESSAYLGEQDALAVRYNSQQKAWGWDVTASQYRQQAKIYRAGVRSSTGSALTSVAGGLSSMFGMGLMGVAGSGKQANGDYASQASGQRQYTA